MKVPKETLRSSSAGRGFRHYSWLRFEIQAFLHNIKSNQTWHYKVFFWPKDRNPKRPAGVPETIFEYSSVGLSWNERRFIRALEDALDNEVNRHRLIMAAFDDFRDWP